MEWLEHLFIQLGFLAFIGFLAFAVYLSFRYGHDDPHEQSGHPSRWYSETVTTPAPESDEENEETSSNGTDPTE